MLSPTIHSPTPSATPISPLDQETVLAALTRVLNSKWFKSAPRLSRFLTYTTERALGGDTSNVKEYTIAIAVFGKDESFDPRLDSTVRVAARQLRAKLDQYYLSEGASDPVLIRFRLGDYVPRIFHRPVVQRNGSAAPQPHTAVIAERNRATARLLAEYAQSVGVEPVTVTDSGELALESVRNSLMPIVFAGMNLTGGMTGLELLIGARAFAGALTVAVLPSAVDGSAPGEIVACDPDAIVLTPVRSSDVAAAVQIAAAKAAARKLRM